ncbi:MAG TPA: SH3 domain-containing protein, partial [Candidatus Ozemobacteraceae bacterium]|nr:SH3 domain-containing protein [Candidatus Ozemobacteraceae bacterium]
MSTRMKVLFVCTVVLVFGALSPALAGNPYGDENVSGVEGTNVAQGGATAQAPVTAVQIPDQFTGTVFTGDANLNVRSGPWGDIIGSLSNGTKIKVVGKHFDWYKIEHNGKTAYVHSAWVLAPGETAKPFPRAGWVNAPTGLNVRRVPNGDVIGTLKDQVHVEILGVAGDFYKIKYGNNEAFVSRKYIDTNQPGKPSGEQVTAANFTGYVTASSLNVREAPW